MKALYDKEALVSTLLDIDEEAFLILGMKTHFQLIIVGGCALFLSDLTTRPLTQDIDILRYNEKLKKVIKRHPEVNDQAEVYRDRLPQGFEDRLVPLPIDTKIIQYHRPSNEDLAVMKLYSWREQDKKDLTSPNMLQYLNRALLEKLIYSEAGAKASSHAPLLYNHMVETYENKFLPLAQKAGKKFQIEAWSTR